MFKFFKKKKEKKLMLDENLFYKIINSLNVCPEKWRWKKAYRYTELRLINSGSIFVICDPLEIGGTPGFLSKEQKVILKETIDTWFYWYDKQRIENFLKAL